MAFFRGLDWQDSSFQRFVARNTVVNTMEI
jgi:hypothetical protein